MMKRRYLPSVRQHQDVTSHSQIEHFRKWYAMSYVAAISMEHNYGRSSCRELDIKK